MRRARLTVALLLAAAAAVHAPALPGPFQFDDHATLAVDPGARALTAWWNGIAAHVRPLAKLTFALTHPLGEALGHVPLGHRGVALTIHLLTVLAAVALGRRLLATCAPRADPHVADRAAIAAAAVLALHPLSTEAVAYLGGRAAALATLLSMLATLAWIDVRSATAHRTAARSSGAECATGAAIAKDALETSGSTRAGGAARAALALVLLAAAILSREAAIALPAFWLAWEAARHDAPHAPWSAARLRAAARAAAAPALAVVAALAWLAWNDRYAALLGFSHGLLEAHGGRASLLPALDHFARTALLLRYPSIDPPADAYAWDVASRTAGTVLLCAALATVWAARRTRPHWLVAAAWIAVWVVPTYLLPIRHDAVSERHLYPALWGAALPLALAWSSWFARRRASRAAAGALGAVAIAVFAIVTMVRASDWRSEVALWEAAERSAPSRARVLNNLGVAYMAAGRWDDARQVLARAAALAPGDARVRDNLRAARDEDLSDLGGLAGPRQD